MAAYGSDTYGSGTYGSGTYGSGTYGGLPTIIDAAASLSGSGTFKAKAVVYTDAMSGTVTVTGTAVEYFARSLSADEWDTLIVSTLAFLIVFLRRPRRPPGRSSPAAAVGLQFYVSASVIVRVYNQHRAP